TRPLSLLAAAALALAAAPAADAHHDAPPAPRLPGLGAARAQPDCRDSYREVRGQGNSCRVAPGLWKVKVRDGHTLLTHGADPAPTDDAPAIARGFTHQLGPDVVPRRPVCADTNRFRALIAVPADVTNDETVEAFRGQIELADGTFF